MEHELSLPQGQILAILLAFTKSVLYSPSAIRAGVVSESLEPHLNSSQHCGSTMEAPCIPDQEPLLWEALGAHHRCPGDGLLVEPMWLEPSLCVTSPHYPLHSSGAFYTFPLVAQTGSQADNSSRRAQCLSNLSVGQGWQVCRDGTSTDRWCFSSPCFPSPSHNPPG